VPLLDLQVRFRELGRIRAGEKGPKGEPRKRSTWRITSASQALLEQAAALPEIGGTVREWKDAPDEGYYELLAETDRLDVMIPPVADAGALISQWYELWSGGGCVRRCDGINEALSGGPCICDAEERACTPTTRLSVMIPKLGGIGVWRLDTGGINAALELPGAFGLIVKAADGQFMPAVLRLEQRSSKKEGTTRRYVVPVLDMEQASILELVSGKVPAVLGPAVATGRPELPAAGEPPKGNGAEFESTKGPEVSHGEPPPLPGEEAKTISGPQRARLFAIAAEHGVTKDHLKELVRAQTGQESTAKMSIPDYEAIVSLVESRA
jgi:recombination directionality factor gp3-like protein